MLVNPFQLLRALSTVYCFVSSEVSCFLLEGHICILIIIIIFHHLQFQLVFACSGYLCVSMNFFQMCCKGVFFVKSHLAYITVRSFAFAFQLPSCPGIRYHILCRCYVIFMCWLNVSLETGFDCCLEVTHITVMSIFMCWLGMCFETGFLICFEVTYLTVIFVFFMSTFMCCLDMCFETSFVSNFVITYVTFIFIFLILFSQESGSKGC